MNTSTKTLFATAAMALIAIVGATGLVLGQAEHAPQQEVVQLERVVITGKRADAQVVAQLPRVVVTGRRADAGTQLAAARVCAAETAVC